MPRHAESDRRRRGGARRRGSGGVCPRTNPSLYSGPGPKPGPAILYQAPATAPQLTNAGPWKAQPILVSGATAYRSGEFVYQDYLYDDHGARELPDPTDPRASSEGDLFSKPNGTYTYPTGPGYDDDAADLVEFRTKPLANATAFRVTLNTLENPSLIAFSIAIGAPPEPSSRSPTARTSVRQQACSSPSTRRAPSWLRTSSAQAATLR
jgi:hypothetical protein